MYVLADDKDPNLAHFLSSTMDLQATVVQHPTFLRLNLKVRNLSPSPLKLSVDSVCVTGVDSLGKSNHFPVKSLDHLIKELNRALQEKKDADIAANVILGVLLIGLVVAVAAASSSDDSSYDNSTTASSGSSSGGSVSESQKDELALEIDTLRTKYLQSNVVPSDGELQTYVITSFEQSFSDTLLVRIGFPDRPAFVANFVKASW